MMEFLPEPGLDVLEEEAFISEEKELIHGAPADKFNLEAIVQNHMLITRTDVIITPHIAFNSVEALQKITKRPSKTLRRFKRVLPHQFDKSLRAASPAST